MTLSGTTELRLVKSDSAKWTDPTIVRSVTVNSTVLTNATWNSARGPDYTSTHAGIWLEHKGEISIWERVVIPLGGGSHSQRPVGVDLDVIPSVLRAGHPLGSKSITQTSEDFPPPENAALPLVEWSGSATADYAPFGPVSNVVDVAPDPGGSGIWILRAMPFAQVEHRSASGSLLEAIPIDDAPGSPIGLHVLETPIEIEVGGEEEGEEE